MRRTLNWVPSTVTRLSPLPTRKGRAGSWPVSYTHLDVYKRQAHVRGGGELGEAWYRAGKLEHKQNSFDDFIACAEHLLAEGYCRPEGLAISGGSAGGLLIGAVLNQRPQLFGAAIAEVPFVDVLNSMLNPDLPLTVTEYDEWGNPQEPEVHALSLIHIFHGQGVAVAGAGFQGGAAGEDEAHPGDALQALAGGGDQGIERNFPGIDPDRPEGAHGIDDQALARCV